MHNSFFGVDAEPAPNNHTAAKKMVSSSSTSISGFMANYLEGLLGDVFRCMVTNYIDIISYMSRTDAERQQHSLAVRA